MGKVIWTGWAKSADEAHSSGAILTGANLRPLSERKSPKPKVETPKQEE